MKKISLPLPPPKRVATVRIVETFIVAVFSIVLMITGIVPSHLRYFVLIGIFGYSLIVILLRGWTAEELGIRKDTLVYWPWYLVCTCIAIGVLFATHHMLGMPFPKWTLLEFIVLAIISFALSIIQEFLYRSWLFRLFLDISKNPKFSIVMSAVLFAFMHVIFPQLDTVLPLTIIGGFMFAILYSKYQNFYLVSASHFPINLTAVALGFFPIDLFRFLFRMIE